VLIRAVLAALLAVAAWAAPAAALPQDPPGHDPTLIRQGEWYYAFTTPSAPGDGYLPMRRSRDLVHWELVGSVFAFPPPWIPETLGVVPDALWAPDISYRDGRFWLYYAASQWGTNNSAIGLATSPTLDPTDPAHGWTDQGLVMRTTPGVDFFNAIDPEIVTDEAGALWMAFGSFFSGIKLRRLDPATGKPLEPDPGWHDLAARPEGVEAPSLVHHDGFYYLIVSFDGCCTGVASTYRLAVGRAKEITGPYVDKAGVPMLEGGGTVLLEGYDTFAGTGHDDVLRDGGADWLIHHYYDREQDGARKLSVRRLDWGPDGWPVANAPLTAGGPGLAPADLATGRRPADAPRCWAFAGPPPPHPAAFRVRWRPVGPAEWRLCAA